MPNAGNASSASDERRERLCETRGRTREGRAESRLRALEGQTGGPCRGRSVAPARCHRLLPHTTPEARARYALRAVPLTPVGRRFAPAVRMKLERYFEAGADAKAV